MFFVSHSSNQVSTETKEELSLPVKSDEEKSEQTTTSETSDQASDDVTDPNPLEDAKMDPEEMPDLGEEEPASDDVANGTLCCSYRTRGREDGFGL